jgi:hypothetical protein
MFINFWALRNYLFDQDIKKQEIKAVKTNQTDYAAGLGKSLTLKSSY